MAVLGGIGVIAVAAGSVIGLLFIAAAVGLFFFIKKKNEAVPATTARIMAEERRLAGDFAVNQARHDLQIDDEVWRTARDSGHCVSIMEATDVVVFAAGHKLSPKVRIVTTAILPAGLLHHETVWDALSHTSSHPEYEVLPWSRIARVRRDSGRLLIESVGGSSISVQINGEGVVNNTTRLALSDEELITRTVLPFVSAAQQRLLNS